jgi:hypothetical protein
MDRLEERMDLLAEVMGHREVVMVDLTEAG